jgi:hypothetical protein
MFNGRSERLRDLSRGAPPRIPQPEGLALPLYPHQISAVEYASMAPRMIISDRPRAGKDISAIAVQVELAQGRFLVATAPALIGTWDAHLRQAVPDRRIVTVDPGRGVSRAELVAGDVVLLRHRQMARAVEELAETGFGGLIFDQCQVLACSWSRLAAATRRFVEGLAPHSPVVASSSGAARSPRTLAGAVDAIGRLDRHPGLAAVRAHRSWAAVPDAQNILERLRRDCLLARDVESLVAWAGPSGAQSVVACR